MSAQDVLPDAADTATEDPADLEEWLAESFEEVAEMNHGRRHGDHDADGYYAELAGSPACLALGHVARVDEGHPLFEEWEAVHPFSWDGEHLCKPTAYATACTACEGDCGLFFEPVSLWTLPGVTGAPVHTDRSTS